MASSNPIYDAIEDELVRHLEAGGNLPKAFTVTLSEEEWMALLAGGLIDSATGLRFSSAATKRVVCRMAGHTVTVRSEKDPEPPDGRC